MEGARVGVIYGNVGSTECDIAVLDPTLMRLEYVELEHEGNRVLCTVQETTLSSSLSYEDAKSGEASAGGQHRAHIRVIGFKDKNGRTMVPRTPLGSGNPVFRAKPDLIRAVLGLDRSSGAPLGNVRGLDIPVSLDLNIMAQKHVSVLAMTGAGKSYTVGVILESFLLAGVPLVILDPHGEYSSLQRANLNPKDMQKLTRLGLKPKSFHKEVMEYAADTQVNRDAIPIKFDSRAIEARDIAELLPQKLPAAQLGILYQAVRDAKELDSGYTLHDVREACDQSKSTSKWTVLNALDGLLDMGIWSPNATKIQDLVRGNQCSVLNLKGVPPELQDVIALRLVTQLWEARKRSEIPPHILVVEEAHNFCPERGVGNALTGPILRTVAAEGRKFGMGLVIVSQRPAKVDKNVLSQCNTQFVLKVTNPNDLRAIVSSVEGITNETADEIQRLNVGVALVAGGGMTQPVFVDVRPRLTSHGGDSIDVVSKDLKPVEWEIPIPTLEPNVSEPKREPRKVKPKVEPIPEPIPDPEPMEFVVEIEEPEEEILDLHAPIPEPQSLGLEAALRRAKKYEQENRAETSKVDAKRVARVAVRIGVVTEAQRTGATERLRLLASNQGLEPDHYVAWYDQIGRVACLEDVPRCIQCPLQDRCETHAKMRQERVAVRKQERSPLRRLWNR